MDQQKFLEQMERRQRDWMEMWRQEVRDNGGEPEIIERIVDVYIAYFIPDSTPGINNPDN